MAPLSSRFNALPISRSAAVILLVISFFVIGGSVVDPYWSWLNPFWKTYKNEKFGFEIKYPPQFQVKDYGSGITIFKPDGEYYFNISVRKDSDVPALKEKGLEKWVKEAIGPVFNIEVNPGKMNGIEGVEVRGMASHHIGSDFHNFYFERNGYLWDLGLYDNLKYSLTYWRIKSSLKLTR